MMGSAASVYSMHWNIPNDGADDVQMVKHVGFKKISFFYFFNWQVFDYFCVNGGVPIGGVHAVPVAAA